MKTVALMAICLATSLPASAGATELEGATPRYIGIVTGVPEKDTFGYPAREIAARPPTAPVLSGHPDYVGVRTGDEEKDSFGYLAAPRWKTAAHSE